MLAPEEAWSRLEPWLPPLPAVRSSRRAALGARLGEPIAARGDLPPMDVSALDGYALAADAPAGTTLPVALTLAAGDAPGAALPPGTAARIMTGAPVPAGADRVIAVEATQRVAGAVDQVLLLAAGPAAGAAIRRRGEVVTRGAPLLEAGTRLGPAALALLASQGIDQILVVGTPRVAVLATGDEVVAPDREPPPGGLRDSHTDFLLAAGRRLGIEFESLGIAPDDPERLETAVARGLEADVLITTGGVSAGDFDLAEPAFARLGCQPLFDAVAIQPGKPMVAARGPRGLLFGLPGNPTSAMVTFALFVAPALERLRGGDARFWGDAFEVELAAALPGAKDRDRFVPARRGGPGAARSALPLAARGSHDLVAFAGAELLLRVPAGAPPRARGQLAEAIALP